MAHALIAVVLIGLPTLRMALSLDGDTPVRSTTRSATQHTSGLAKVELNLWETGGPEMTRTSGLPCWDCKV